MVLNLIKMKKHLLGAHSRSRTGDLLNVLDSRTLSSNRVSITVTTKPMCRSVN